MPPNSHRLNAGGGFRPYTPDEGLLFLFLSLDSLLMACNHHRNGVLLVAIAAELRGDLAINNKE